MYMMWSPFQSVRVEGSDGGYFGVSRCSGTVSQTSSLEMIISLHVAGDLFSLSPKMVNKLNLDSDGREHAQLTSINHRIFFLSFLFLQAQMGREEHKEEREGAGELCGLSMDLGNIERKISWAFFHRFFFHLPGSYPAI